MLSHLDDLGLRAEADLIYHIALAGIPLPVAETMELWELAAARGLHYTESLQEKNIRETDEEQAAYYEETREQREAMIARQAERRRERKAGR